MVQRRPDANNNFATKQLNRVFETYKGICQICFKECPRSEASREHVIPLREGGSIEDHNVVLAHWICNNDRDCITKKIFGCLRRQAQGLPVHSEYSPKRWERSVLIMSTDDRVIVSSPLFADSSFLGKRGTVVAVLTDGFIDVQLDDIDGLVPFRRRELSLIESP